MVKGLLASAVLIMAESAAAAAALVTPSVDAQPRVFLVSGGCGLAFHRNPFGACAPNRSFYVGGPPVVRLPPPCPRFYHRDPDPARPICYPNF